MKFALVKLTLRLRYHLTKLRPQGWLYQIAVSFMELANSKNNPGPFIKASLYITNQQKALACFKASLSIPAEPIQGAETVTLERACLLKPPLSDNERGVILVSFESQLNELLKLNRFEELQNRYAIAFMPTWQPAYSSELHRLIQRSKKVFFLLPSSKRDADVCKQLSSRCISVPLSAANWVKSPSESVVQRARNIDLLMLANFGTYKQHWRLFEALRRLPLSTNVVVAGRPLGSRTLKNLIKEARAFGVSDRIKWEENPTDDRVQELLACAKVFCALSHREGAYIAVAEAIAFGANVAMFSNAVIGCKDFINTNTGQLIDPSEDLAAALNAMIRVSDGQIAARWANKNISSSVSCEVLNKYLSEALTSNNEVWTQPIQAFYSTNFRFVADGPIDRPAHDVALLRLKSEFGLSLPSLSPAK
jgi:Glycosyl transferases group 1